jgi:hypothetical protein
VPFIGGSLKQFLDPSLVAAMLDRLIDWIEDGTLPKAQLCNIQFSEFISDQMGTVEMIYRQYGIEMKAESRAAMQKYIEAKPNLQKPKHEYNVGATEMISRERKLFKRYQDYFSVLSEV